MTQHQATVFKLVQPFLSKKFDQDLSYLLAKAPTPSIQINTRVLTSGNSFSPLETKNRQCLHKLLLTITTNPEQVPLIKDQLVKTLADSSLHSMHGHPHFHSRFIYYDIIELKTSGAGECKSLTFLAYGLNNNNLPGILGAVMLKPNSGYKSVRPQTMSVLNSRTKQWKEEHIRQSCIPQSTEWILHYIPNMSHLTPPINCVNVSSRLCYMSMPGDLDSPLVHLSQLRPGQYRYSAENVRKKIQKFIKKGAVVYNSNTCRYEGKYFNGKSAFSGIKDDAIPIVKTAFGNMIIDGHHDVISMIELGLSFIPVTVKENLTSIQSEQHLCEMMSEKGWLYLYDLSNQKMNAPPTTLLKEADTLWLEMLTRKCDSPRHNLHLSNMNYPLWFEKSLNLEDDPNRYFAALTACRCQSINTLNYPNQSPDFPLWVKMGKGVPFIEFYISDRLSEKGFQYGQDSDIEKARKILVQVKREGLHVIKTRKHFTEISLNDLTNM